MKNIKSLGQHWLKDRQVLEAIVDFAGVTAKDTVLEIGPGLGTLTSSLLKRANRVIAVEYDSDLAAKLPAQFPGKNLEVINADILQFDLNQLPANYKVVANLPYYITSKIINYLLNSENRPQSITILVQKEVAQRLAQVDGGSILGLVAENVAEVELGPVVPAELFFPPPKVDSQVVKLTLRSHPKVADLEAIMPIIKAGFSARRKKLRSSLAGGLHLDKKQVEQLLTELTIDPNLRAQDLKLTDWVVIGAKIKR